MAALTYWEEPRPWTVENKPVELTYWEEPRPITVEAIIVVLTNPEEPRPIIDDISPVTGELR